MEALTLCLTHPPVLPKEQDAIAPAPFKSWAHLCPSARNPVVPLRYLLREIRNTIFRKSQLTMPTSTLTTRGQTTIPKSIRDALDLQPGDRLEFTLQGDRVVLRRAEADLSALDGMLDRSGTEPVSVEDMNEAIGEAARDGVESSESNRGQS